MPLANRTTDDRLDDLLEAVEKRAAHASVQRERLEKAVEILETELSRLHSTVWWTAILMVFGFIGGSVTVVILQ